MSREPLSADRVLVTVGTLCSVSSVGTTETHRAVALNSSQVDGFAAFDAGLVDFAGGTAERPKFVRLGEGSGESIGVDEISEEFGARLRTGMGIRPLAREQLADHVLCDVAAPLPHDLESGGLRRLAGLNFRDIRGSGLADMFGLFDDDPRLGPSLQSQLFMYGGIGALAALPEPLSEMMPEPHRFRVAAASAFPGMDSHSAMGLGMQPKQELVPDKKNDRLAFRLAASLSTHGPAMVSAMLSPGFSLSRVRRRPEILDALAQSGSPFRRVPQAPMVSSAACASALVSLNDAATQMIARYPGQVPPELIIWTAADAGLLPDARILEAFGLAAMMTRDKLDEINRDRASSEHRDVRDCLAPFDVDAQGTVVGHGGSGVVVTTLEFALRHGLDITSILVGWGQSGETGGKGHFAGVGFGGENALIGALQMAEAAHGYQVKDFGHVVAHATGTRTNSRTELSNLHWARTVVAERQGVKTLPRVTLGAPKAVGDGHTMGETGLKAVGEAIRYVLGEATVGVPTLRNLDPDLGPPAEHVCLAADSVRGDADGGALVPTQGFGGYDGAVALRSASPEALSRYETEPGLLESYLERWPEIRSEREARETRWRRTRGFVLELADHHRWAGPARGQS